MSEHFYTYPTVIELRPQTDRSVATPAVDQRPESGFSKRGDRSGAQLPIRAPVGAPR